ncbi:MAG: peptidase M64 [Bacteroidales bacterium]|nr:peptidase M64 [Bacteroidales bacterium]
MLRFIFIPFILICFFSFCQVSFNDYFLPKTLRVDFILAGNDHEENIYLLDLSEEPFYGGSKTNLIDKFDYGEYKFEVFDFESGNLIYSRGFCTLFEEWQTTEEAKKTEKSFYEVITFPYPKNKIILKILSRNWNGKFIKLFELEIDPNNYFIKEEKYAEFKTKKIHDSGNPSVKVDIVLLAEGYTSDEMDKFRKDVTELTEYFFKAQPFDEYKNKFNIWLIESDSKESGTDIPAKSIWKNTVLNSSFYTFDMERYISIYDYKTVRDIASLVPYDIIYVIVNTDKYGGGGIYNHYNICTSNNKYSNNVFVHEFGHGFAGLADEYYTSSVAYNNFFNLEIEPWQPNITTLVNFENKWNNMLDKNVPVPTPELLIYKNIIGVYEGGGYIAKGVYRPFINCRMNSNTAKGFCPVCKKSIIKMIDFYTE